MADIVHSKQADETPPSAADDPERVLRSAGAGRFLLRAGVAVAVLAALGAGGFFGYRAFRAARAKGAPMVVFSSTKATIGNDLFETDRPAHQVSLDAFALDRTEVTVAVYQVCIDDGACTAPAKGPYCNLGQEKREDHPINCVTHAQAAAFCAWAGKRLPTEKEWERAARVAHLGDKKKEPNYGMGEGLFPWGTDRPTKREANVCRGECRAYAHERGQAWPSFYVYAGEEEEDDGFPTTAPVGSFRHGETPDGLLDMAGNVWEWTASPFCAYPDDECGNKVEYVIRGGGFLSYNPRNIEVTAREAMPASDANHAVGFRCAKSG